MLDGPKNTEWGFNISVCFLYRDEEGNETLQWCKGTIVHIHNDKSNNKSILLH